MQLIPVASPPVLPTIVACYSARLADADGREHFAAGRECAARAISQLTGQAPEHDIPRGPAGEPLWPAGLTGSITHTGDFVSVAIARATAVRAIGLDAERIVEPDRSRRVAPMIVQPGEPADGDEEAPGPVRVTLIFSIKEAVFKCLYPLVRERFYYPALLVTALDFSTGVFGAELAVSLPGHWLRKHALHVAAPNISNSRSTLA